MSIIQTIKERYKFSKSRTPKKIFKMSCFFLVLFIFFPIVLNANPVSSDVSISATVADTGSSTSSGGGSIPTNIIFSGSAYQFSRVIILKDGQEISNTILGSDGKFNIFISNLTSGIHNFLILGEDSQGLRSRPITISLFLKRGTTTTISNIFITLTIEEPIVKPIEKEKKHCFLRGDLNDDCRVNLVDFSIMKYWYYHSLPPKNVDLSGDGKISLVDFSIMIYYWTG